jgi:hypothetical protein
MVLILNGGDIKHDPLEDWSRFWLPIMGALLALLNHGNQPRRRDPDDIS